jgi:hypothetical protein
VLQGKRCAPPMKEAATCVAGQEVCAADEGGCGASCWLAVAAGVATLTKDRRTVNKSAHHVNLEE